MPKTLPFVGVVTFEDLADEWSSPLTRVSEPQKTWEDARREIVRVAVDSLRRGAENISRQGDAEGAQSMRDALQRVNEYYPAARYSFTVGGRRNQYRVRISVADARYTPGD